MNRFSGMGVLLILLLASGCATNSPSQTSLNDDKIVGMIGTEPVTLAELKDQYSKSNEQMSDSADGQALLDFLDLYMNYRLKLAIASDAGYMDDTGILTELEHYKRQSAYTFWVEHQIREKMLDEMQERAKEQIHAQHILIEIPENAFPEDTARAWNKLMEAREKFLNNEENFLALSREYSSKKRGQSMGGDLGYFSTGWAVKPFEDAAYSLKTGEVSMPFRSPFGYHIVHVVNRTKSVAEKKFSHIFFMNRGISDPIDTVLAKAKVVYDSLAAGEEWSSMVETYSEDDKSRLSDGDIGWVRYGMYDQSFTDTLMSIKQTGNITKPFVSPYGIHIARLDSINQASDDEIRSELAEKLRQIPRYREDKQNVIDNAADMGKAKYNRENLAKFENFILENYSGDFSTITFPDAILDSTIFTFHNKHWNGIDYLEWLKPVMQENDYGRYHTSLADDFREFVIDSSLIDLTIDTFPDFRELTRDYLFGLAVFKVNEDSVWAYAQNDTLRLRQLYESNQSAYRQDIKYQFIQFSAPSDSVLDEIQYRVSNGTDADDISEMFTGTLVQRDIVSQTDMAPYNLLNDLGEGDFSSYFDHQQHRTTFYLEKIIEARPLTFEEARNMLVTDYQSIREEEWVQKMREQYNVKVWPEVLRSTIAGKND